MAVVGALRPAAGARAKGGCRISLQAFSLGRQIRLSCPKADPLVECLKPSPQQQTVEAAPYTVERIVQIER